MSFPQDHDLRTLFAPARAVVPGHELVDGALQRAPHRPDLDAARRPAPRRRGARPLRRALVASVALLLALTGLGYAAAPPIRAAIDGASGTFTGWFAGDDTAPGRPARAGDRLPDYMRRSGRSGARVVAEAGGYRLFAARLPNGGIDFDLGNTGVGLGFTPTSLLDHDIRVLGPGSMRTADHHGHVPLFGVTSRSVRTVELENRDGSISSRTRVAGAFVLLAEPDRHPIAVIGRDDRGRTIERAAVDDGADPCPCIDWDQYLR